MGFTNSGNKTFLTVADGKIIQKVTEDTPGAIKRINKENKTVYELRHGGFEGYITNINVTEREFGGKKMKQWNIDIDDIGDQYQLQLSYSSGYSMSFLKSILNPVIDFSQPIKITPWMKVVNEKKKTAIYLAQNGEDIPWFFTKENPNGLPELKKVRIGGEEKWDDYDAMQFMEAQIKAKVLPQLGKTKNGVSTTSNSGTPVDPNNAPEEDDLPF